MRTRTRPGLIVFLSCLTALACLALPGSAFADAPAFNIRTPFTFEGIDCMGEPFVITGVQHFEFHAVQDQSGGTHYEAHQDIQGQGTGVSGTKYVLNDSGNTIGTSGTNSADVFTFVFHFNIIRQGETPTAPENTDDFMDHQVIHVTFAPDGTPTAMVIENRVECK